MLRRERMACETALRVCLSHDGETYFPATK